MKIVDLFDLFVNDRKTYCAPDSVRFYRENLAFFIRYLLSSGIDDTEQLHPDVLRSFAVYLRDERKIKSTSIHTYFRGIYAFLHWAIEEEYIPAFKYKIKLPRRTLKQFFPFRNLKLNCFFKPYLLPAKTRNEIYLSSGLCLTVASGAPK